MGAQKMSWLILIALLYFVSRNREMVAKYVPASVSSKVNQIFSDRARLVIQLQTVVLLCSTMYLVLTFVDFFVGWGLAAPFYQIAIWSAFLASIVTIGANRGAPPFSAGKDACLECLH